MFKVRYTTTAQNHSRLGRLYTLEFAEAELWHSALTASITGSFQQDTLDYNLFDDSLNYGGLLKAWGNRAKPLLQYHDNKYRLFVESFTYLHRDRNLGIKLELLSALETREKALASEYLGIILTHLFTRRLCGCTVVLPMTSQHLSTKVESHSNYRPDFIGIDTLGNYHITEAKGSFYGSGHALRAKGLEQVKAISVIDSKPPLSRTVGLLTHDEGLLHFHFIKSGRSSKGKVHIPKDEVFIVIGYHVMAMASLAGFSFTGAHSGPLFKEYGVNSNPFYLEDQLYQKRFQIQISHTLLCEVLIPFAKTGRRLKSNQLSSLGQLYLKWLSAEDGFLVIEQ